MSPRRLDVDSYLGKDIGIRNPEDNLLVTPKVMTFNGDHTQAKLIDIEALMAQSCNTSKH